MLKLTYQDLHAACELALEVNRLESALDNEFGDVPTKKLTLFGCSVLIPDAVIKVHIKDRIAVCQKALNDKGIELQAGASQVRPSSAASETQTGTLTFNVTDIPSRASLEGMAAGGWIGRT